MITGYGPPRVGYSMAIERSLLRCASCSVALGMEPTANGSPVVMYVVLTVVVDDDCDVIGAGSCGADEHAAASTTAASATILFFILPSIRLNCISTGNAR